MASGELASHGIGISEASLHHPAAPSGSWTVGSQAKLLSSASTVYMCFGPGFMSPLPLEGKAPGGATYKAALS